MKRSQLGWCAAALLLLVLVAEVALSTRHNSLSWDEGDHIFSGYMNWKHGEYDLNPEHPPLIKLVATLPLLPLDLKVAPREGRYFKSEAYYGGRELLFRNDPSYGGHYSADTLIFRVHMAVMVFALLLGCFVFLAGSEMFGTAAGLIALALFVFDPTILTNAPFVTTDTGAACGIFASVFVFYRYLKLPSWQRLVLCGITFGLALTCKHSTVLLLPILLLLAVGELVGQWRGSRRNGFRQLAGPMLAMVAISLFVLWAVYGFRFAMHPEGMRMPSLATQVGQIPTLSAHIIHFCARFHLLPESYLYGLVDVQLVGNDMPSYILGKLYAHGQWFYFPLALSLKWTIGTLGLLALALYAFASGRLRQPREIFFLTLPPAFYLLVAILSPLNIGIRHVLPIFPFAFVLAGAGASALLRQRRAWIYPIAALLLWHMVDSVRMYPNYMPYANAFWGGPTKTHLYLSDSATDWGQQLKYTRAYLDEHHIHDCWFAYFPAPFLLPSDYGVPCKLLPTLDTMYETDIAVPPIVHGPILVSYGDLNGFEFGTKVRNPYQQLFERAPDDVIANGIAVFHGDFALPGAAALAPAHHAEKLLKQDPEGALREALAALLFDPSSFDGHLIAGDALHALHRDAEARAQYNAAIVLVGGMEPTSQEYWRPRVIAKLALASS